LQFRVDKTPPKIVYTDINSDDNLFTPILTVDGYYTFNWVESSKNPIGATFDGSLLTPVFSVMNDGTYVFTLNAYDEFDNKSSYSFTFTYKLQLLHHYQHQPQWLQMLYICHQLMTEKFLGMRI